MLRKIAKPYIDKYKLYYLLHFTHKRNINSILERGILSKNELKRHGIRYISIADEKVQAIRNNIEFHLKGHIIKSLHDCVPLYISWRTPTLFKILQRENIQRQDIIHILVDTYKILDKNYCFTDGNAASYSTKQYILIENLDRLDWNTIKKDNWGWGKDRDELKRKKNAEFLVYPKIELKDFYQIVVFDEKTKKEIEKTLRKYSVELKVRVDKRYYTWPQHY